MNKIGILGSGSFACSLAYQLSLNKDNEVVLFARDQQQVLDINKNNCNSKYFSSLHFNSNVSASQNYEELSAYNTIIIAIPSSALKDFDQIFSTFISKDSLIINLAKGLSPNGHTIVDYLVENHNLKNIVSLKGPSFSVELTNNSPTILTLGYSTFDQSERVNELFKNTNIYFDYTTDINGVEYLSALKNIYAIYIGHIDGKFNSFNTKYFILNQCFTEIKSILNHLRCKPSTADLSCGFGDLCLTSLSDLSRNRTLGLMIGKGLYTSDVLAQSSIVFEGIYTIKVLREILSKKVIHTLPILDNLISFLVTHESASLSTNFNTILDQRMKTVLTYGTFDLLHYGHLEILKRAKNMGDRLIVGLSTDEFNLKKDKVCKFSYKKRKEFLESLDYVDLVIPESHWEQKKDDIKNLKVDTFVMGNDWKGKFDELKEYCEVVYLPRTKGISTTKLKKILKED